MKMKKHRNNLIQLRYKYGDILSRDMKTTYTLIRLYTSRVDLFIAVNCQSHGHMRRNVSAFL